MAQRTAGLIQVQINGEIFSAKGNFTFNLGRPLNEGIVGSDGMHGFKSTPQPGFIEGEFTDRGGLDLEALVALTGASVTITQGNGKLFILSDAYYAGEGTGNTEEANVAVRFEGNAQEVEP